jgi:hypothetical protein
MKQHQKLVTSILGAALATLVGLLDHITGYELGFFVFYFIPVSYVAWISGTLFGVIVSVACAAIWFFVDAISGHPYSSPWYGVWNAGIRLISFLIITLAASRVRELLDSERGLSARLQEALNQVKELRGLLPICASCKKIRNDTGYWEQIEGYVSRHSRAEFTHGICPECAQRLYPQFFDGEDTPAPPHPAGTDTTGYIK